MKTGNSDLYRVLYGKALFPELADYDFTDTLESIMALAYQCNTAEINLLITDIGRGMIPLKKHLYHARAVRDLLSDEVRRRAEFGEHHEK